MIQNRPRLSSCDKITHSLNYLSAQEHAANHGTRDSA